MAAISTIIAAVTLTASVYSAQEQKKEAKKAAVAQTNIRNEEKAANTAKQMSERRQQVREERIKRARVLQASQNTGVAGGSGETGAVAALNTNLGSNLGSNSSAVMAGDRVSVFAQQAATAQNAGQNAALFGSLAIAAAPTVTKVGESIFQPTKKIE